MYKPGVQRGIEPLGTPEGCVAHRAHRLLPTPARRSVLIWCRKSIVRTFYNMEPKGTDYTLKEKYTNDITLYTRSLRIPDHVRSKFMYWGRSSVDNIFCVCECVMCKNSSRMHIKMSLPKERVLLQSYFLQDHAKVKSMTESSSNADLVVKTRMWSKAGSNIKYLIV